MTQAAERQAALAEIRFCEAVLAKSGETPLLATLGGATALAAYEHFPHGDVTDPQSGAHWYYHSHGPQSESAEHGHYHLFLRPNGRGAPIHHLIAIGVDALSHPVRLFTVNQWVVDDDWLPAEATIALLARFDAHFNRPSYLVNRWLTGLMRYWETEIAELIRARDAAIAGRGDPDAARRDRTLEVASERAVALSNA